MDPTILRQVFRDHDADDGEDITEDAKDFARRLVAKRRLERYERAKIVDPSRSTAEQESRTAYNEANGPLFTLPTELRIRIYKYALGGRNLHICWHNFTNEEGCLAFNATPYRDPRFWAPSSPLTPQEMLALAAFPEEVQPYKGLSCRVCQVPESDATTYARSKSDSTGEDVALSPYPERHAECLASNAKIHLDTDADSSKHQGLPVSLLRTCRSIHREAASILLSDNTFSFSKPGILDAFLRLALTSSQRKRLQNVHVYAEDPGFCLGAYGFGMYGFSLQDRYQQTASLLTGLKGLEITLGKCMAKSLTRLLAFGTSLESVEVVIGPQGKEDFGGTGFSCGQNRKMAEAIEKALMYQTHEVGETGSAGDGEAANDMSMSEGPHNTDVREAECEDEQFDDRKSPALTTYDVHPRL
ncbi:hypothetical protein CERZMDRAFT_88595 [Cercospora zeae-maydis SCOH1-5]|uniref:Uncharacterized protein n=1 Tax=Cercospora zeae-maydis SCOH1-5 TaxID=717836 RepID=A0A6A6F0V7_9PEZI|nr:hypothetical protein CERZMDRAFT_88595 [Cercospora zeae-maydis SCOH1-5]